MEDVCPPTFIVRYGGYKERYGCLRHHETFECEKIVREDTYNGSADKPEEQEEFKTPQATYTGSSDKQQRQQQQNMNLWTQGRVCAGASSDNDAQKQGLIDRRIRIEKPSAPSHSSVPQGM